MNLKQAQQHLSRDAKYRQTYDKHKDGVELAMHSLAIRKELRISHSDLARELGISKYDISKFENLRGRVQPWVISVIVTRFQSELRQRGLQLERWLVPRPRPKEIAATPGQNAPSSRRPRPGVQAFRHDRGIALPIDRQRLKSQEEEESKV
jgi:transcriptional regulator with XRE-family HTH domain